MNSSWSRLFFVPVLALLPFQISFADGSQTAAGSAPNSQVQTTTPPPQFCTPTDRHQQVTVGKESFYYKCEAGKPHSRTADADGVGNGNEMKANHADGNRNDDYPIFVTDEIRSRVRDAIDISPEIAARCNAYGIDRTIFSSVIRAIAFENVLFEDVSSIDTAFEISEDSQNAAKESFLLLNTLQVLDELGNFVSEQLGSRLNVTGLTKDPALYGDDGHCGHLSGLAFDFRPLPGDRPTTYFENVGTHYKLEYMKVLFAKILNDERVSVVYFNDPKLLADPTLNELMQRRSTTDRPVEFRSFPGHDNHVHVELYPTPALENAANELIGEMN
jgi:hypothetical protein